MKALLRALLAGLLLCVVPLSAQTVAPQFVPYNVTAIAGNTQSSVAGYGGEGVPGLSATLNAPGALAVDSVGNVYIADVSSALIREWNPRTNIIQTIAGVPPSKCTGTACTTINSGCSDGVAASGAPVGSRIDGLVVDGFGNIYFSDYNYQGVWVIYRGGQRVANFIALVDSTTVASASAVQPGYIYHIAGSAVPKAGGCTSSTGTTDNVLATAAKFHDPLQMGIDALGNLYVQDYANNVVRAINTQATTQTILGISIKPGYIASVVGCNATLTVACTASVPPFGSPATTALFNTLVGMTADQYGNVYEINTKGATGSIYAGAAYAGGTPLAHLINLESGLTANVGGWYEVINKITSTYETGYDSTGSVPVALEPGIQANGANNIVLRPSSIAVDPQGNLYMMDYHWQTIYRVDANSQMATRIMPGLLNSGLVAPAGTTAAPAYCSGTTGPQTSDGYGDGCSIQQAKVSTAGTGYVTFDGAGNLYFSDTGDNIVRKVSIGNQFASTTIGATRSQTMQLHFDPTNLPTSNTASAFQILSANSEFAISGVSCANYTIRDSSIECYVTVAFTPKTVGTRGATLQAATTSGTFDFALSGIGGGGEIAVDGGPGSTLNVAGLGQANGVAVDAAGNVYVADAKNSQVIKTAASGGATTKIGTGLSSPMGVAVDPAGNVYISDTGNNRVVEVSASTGVQKNLTSNLNSPTGLSGPTGIAIDNSGNVYVADTGNARIVEIPVFGELSAVPMLAFTGSQALITPVGIALDTSGNIYVADSGNGHGIVKIAAGGGDLQIPSGATAVPSPTSLISFGSASVTAPTGIALDAAGNIYVSDAGSNSVKVIPSGSGPGSEPYTLGVTGLSAPGSLALDAGNNLYIADTNNGRVVFESRAQVALNFGTTARFAAASVVPLIVTNIGTAPVTPVSPFSVLSGSTTSFSETDTCAAANFSVGTLINGLHCGVSVGFQPLTDGALSASASLQGGAATVSLTGTGENPLATLAMVLSSPSGGPVGGQDAVITLTATQTNAPFTPTGTVTFTYTVNGVAQPPVTQALTVNGSTSTTMLTIPSVLLGRAYVITAVYNGDANNSVTTATPLSFNVPGLPLSVVSNSVSYTYGSAVPALTGTVTGILPADQAGITIKFTSNATPSSPVGPYPITVTLTGGNSADYTVPAAVTSTGAPAVVTELQAPLTVVIPNYSEPYGQGNFTYTPTFTGLVNGDTPQYTFTPATSETQPVGTYAIVPTIEILDGTYDRINNYSVKITDGTLTVTKSTPVITPVQTATSVLPTNLTAGTIALTVAQPPGNNYGTPTGTLVLTDTFTPITATGAGTAVTNPPVTLNLTAGAVSYTPTSSTLGTHVYTFAYSGDSNFAATNTSATPTTLIVDQADFTVTSTTSPVLVVPGIVPGGDPTQANEQAATPEQAAVSVAPILGSTATVNLTCAVPASYVTCTLSPTSLTLTGTTTLTSIISISVPATLPIGYTSSLVQPAKQIVLAFLPLGLFALIPTYRKRRRLPTLLLLFIGSVLLITTNGCGGNQVQFFTPVPAGPTSVVVTGTNGTMTRSFTIPINIQ